MTPGTAACSHGRVSLTVLYEDNHLLVVDKPAGLLTQAAQAGDDTLVERARAYLKERWQKPGNVYVGLVHRLDRSTSGVVVLAKTSKAAARLSEQLRLHDDVEKTYLAVVHGAVARGGRLEHTLVEVGDGAAVARPGEAGKRAALSFEPLASTPAAALLVVRIETGRKHQIRVQLAAVGHPLIGDRRYGGPRAAPDARFDPRADQLIGRVALHAWEIALRHPTRREPDAAELRFRAPIPDDFHRLCQALGLGPLPMGGDSGPKKS
ncbi:MAG: RluA family pseudouridine synthase [Myxococcota bacterium]